MGLSRLNWIGLLGVCLSLPAQVWGLQADVAPESLTASASQPASLEAADLEGWLNALSHSQHATRETATQKLLAQGPRILPKLKDRLAVETDAEAKTRLFGIVTQMESDLYEQTIEGFLRESDHSKDYGFRAWQRFQEIAGRNRYAKQLLVDIYRAQPELADAIADGDLDDIQQRSKKAAEAVHEGFTRGRTAEVGDGLALLFAGGVIGKAYDPVVDSVAIRCINTVPLSTRVNAATIKKPVARLMDQWLLSLGPEYLGVAISVLPNHDLPNLPKLAREILEGPFRDHKVLLSHPEDLRACCRILMRARDQQDLPLLDRWLDDQTLVDRFTIYRPVPNPDPNQGNAIQDGADKSDVEEPNRQPLPLPGGRMPGRDLRPLVETQNFAQWQSDVALYTAVFIADLPIGDYFPHLSGLNEQSGLLFRDIGFPEDQPDMRKEAIQRFRDQIAKRNSTRG